MIRFLLSIIFMFFVASVFAKSPHGENFKMDCANCHITGSWEQLNPRLFNHNKTKFPLVGVHKSVECKVCHPTLEFAKAKTQCWECHKDMHQGTVGTDCGRCHTPKSWIVSSVKQIHQQTGFTLNGSHATADCNLCHKSASLLRFENIRTDCYSCHKDKYDATNHRADGFNTDCFHCHNMTGRTWSIAGSGFEHGLFPLSGGHNIACKVCHTTGEYKTKLSVECITCHKAKYDATSSPKHSAVGFSTDCRPCHSINSWTPSTFNHESYFPIKSGRHSGISCAQCHTTTGNYLKFSCVTSSCHGNAHHQNQGASGCYNCHKNG